MSKNTLTAYFDNKNITFVERNSRQELRRFAKKYPLEVTLNAEQTEATFETEDWQFKIRADQNEELQDVFIGTITAFCPERVLYRTVYSQDINVVLASLAVGAMTLERNPSEI